MKIINYLFRSLLNFAQSSNVLGTCAAKECSSKNPSKQFNWTTWKIIFSIFILLSWIQLNSMDAPGKIANIIVMEGDVFKADTQNDSVNVLFMYAYDSNFNLIRTESACGTPICEMYAADLSIGNYFVVATTSDRDSFYNWIMKQ